MIEIILFVVWFLIFMITTIWLIGWVEENNKNFGLTFLYALLYLGISWIVIKFVI